MAEEVKPIKTERIDNSDGTYTVKKVYYTNTAMVTYDKFDRVLCTYWYKEESCTNLIGTLHRDYDEQGNCTEYFVNDTPLPPRNQLSEIHALNNNYQLLSSKIFKDKEFSELIAICNFEYKEFGDYIQYTVYEQPQERNGYLSEIKEYNAKRKEFISTTYYDKEYKNLCEKEYRKYNKNKTMYKTKAQFETAQFDLYYSIINCVNEINNIKKTFYFIDKDYKQLKLCMILINNKQYKFKGILAHILFWLAR